ncbi:Aminotransferase, class I/classII [Dillenia turbinata]|uniref:Aminotransferase, class I/classII n=1 Tax=Dillenia turbinata TaxID=194707 RepID=A0AAN8UXU3_9MAGN
MGNGEKNFNVQGNERLIGSSDTMIRGVLDLLKGNVERSMQKSMIVLGHGDPTSFPGFRTTQDAEEAVLEALKSAQYNCYAPPAGLPSARRAVAEYLSRDVPYELSSTDVHITSGCSHAIEIILKVLARPGVNILLPKPGFPYYEAIAEFNQIEVRHYDLISERGWEINLDQVEALADDNTAAIVVINPGNPSGSVYSYQHLERVAVIAKLLGIPIIADEVYDHLTFGSNPFVRMGVFASLAPVFTLGSISKRWLAPGWRVGWLAICDPAGNFQGNTIDNCIKGCLNIVSGPATFIQGAIPQILENTRKEFFSDINAKLKECAEIAYDKIKEIPLLTCPLKPEGSMFLMVRLNLDLFEDVTDDLDFCLKLAREESLLVLPGFVVGMKNWIRITFAAGLSTLEDGIGRMKSFCMRHSLAAAR